MGKAGDLCRGLVMADPPRDRQQFMLLTAAASAENQSAWSLPSINFVNLGLRSVEEWGNNCNLRTQ